MFPFNILSALFIIVIFGHGQATSVIEAGSLSAKPKSVEHDGTKALYVWYHPGEPMQPFRLWRTVQVLVECLDKSLACDCAIYQNADKSEVVKAHEENRWTISNVFRKWSGTFQPSSYINPFNPVFVGIEADASYSVFLKYKNVDYLLAALFIGGIVLFFAARKLSRSAAAFYAGSTAVGVVGSLMILVFLLYKIAPKRPLAISVLIGGWSFVAYIIYAIWTNLYVVLSHYNRYVAIYLVSVASVSFAAAYLLGPPKGVRTKNVIQWALQIIALLMIYGGCQIPAISVATMVVVLVLSSMPNWVYGQLRWIRYRLFPPKRRLLTEAEYIDQSVHETRRALNELRHYCQSPYCDAWRTMSRLKSPQMFAEFVSGQRSHISDAEILRYSNDSDNEDKDENETDDDDVREIECASRSGSEMNPRVLLSPLPQQRNGSYRHLETNSNGLLTGSAPERLRRQNVTRLMNRTVIGRYD